MIRVLIADDHQMFRQGLAGLIAASPDLELVAGCADGAEALRLIRSHRPDVALLDISMPGIDGISLAACLQREGLATATVVLTGHDDPVVCEQAKSAGVRGFLRKGEAFENLVAVIRQVASDQRAGKQRVVTRPPERQPLTDREREVLGHIARGMSNRLIAATLGVSVKTVDSHRCNLMNKLDLHSTAELVRHALALGLA